MKTLRGFAIPAVLWLVAGLGAAGMTLVPNWRPTHWLKKGPPVAELQAKQMELDKAKAELEAAKKAQADAAAAAEAKKTEQLRWTQQMTVGAANALQREANPSPQVKLGTDLVIRANLGLVLAIGDLPADKRAEILKIVDDALSASEAKVQAAQEALKAKDGELAKVQTEKLAIQAELPKLAAQQAALQQAVAAKETEVKAKTAEVADYALKAAQKEKEAGSLGTQLNNLVRWIAFIGVAYFVLVFVLPLLAKAYPTLGILGKAAQAVVSPLHALETKATEAFARDSVGAVTELNKLIAEKAPQLQGEAIKLTSEWHTLEDGMAQKAAKIQSRLGL